MNTKSVCRTYKNGSKYWYLNRDCHREGNPAVITAAGTKVWYTKGKFHREDGPAIESLHGHKRWFLNNQEYSEEEYNKKIKAMKK